MIEKIPPFERTAGSNRNTERGAGPALDRALEEQAERWRSRPGL